MRNGIDLDTYQLLTAYRKRVSTGAVVFLQDPVEQENAIDCLDALMKQIKSAKKTADARNCDFSEALDWHEAQKAGTKLWRLLASASLQNIDSESKGNSKLFDFLDRMHDGGVIPASQMPANFFQAMLGQVPSQIHTNLTWLGDTLAAFLALKISQTHIKMSGHGLNDVGNADVPGRQFDLPLQGLLGNGQTDLNLIRGGQGINRG